MDFYTYVAAPEFGVGHENPRVQFLGIVATCITKLVLPCAAQVETIAKTSNICVCSSLAKPLMFALSEKFETPLVMVNLQPLTPTEQIPHYSNTDAFIEAITGDDNGDKTEKHMNSYIDLEEHSFNFLKPSMDKLCEDICVENTDRLESFEEWKLCISGRDPTKRVHVAECFSNAVIPKVADVGSLVHPIGPLADSYIPPDFEPPADLVSFLDGCKEAPVCIGYGSMPFDKLSLILSALEEAQAKAILVGDALKIGEGTEFTKTNIFQIGNIPYPWLLPKCSMMFCHGGAGVMNACLRAGIPAIISPLMGDQFVHAKLLAAEGLGAQAATMATLTQEDIVQGIAAGLACREAAKRLGEKIRSGNQKNPVDDMASLVMSIADRD